MEELKLYLESEITKTKECCEIIARLDNYDKWYDYAKYKGMSEAYKNILNQITQKNKQNGKK